MPAATVHDGHEAPRTAARIRRIRLRHIWHGRIQLFSRIQRRRIRPPTKPTALRLITAPVAGVLCYLSFPPRPLWWLTPIAFALLVGCLHGRKARAGFGYGLLFGLGWMLPLVHWLDDLLGPQFGPMPWLAMAVASAVLVALSTAAMAVVSELPLAPVWIAALWVADEALRQRFPFDGFPWGRLAFSQPQGAYLSLASVGGAPLLAFALTLSGAGLALLVRRLLSPLRARTVRELGRVSLLPPSRAGISSDGSQGGGGANIGNIGDDDNAARRRTGHAQQVAVMRRHALAGPVAALLLPIVAGLAVWRGVGTAAQSGSITVAAVQGDAPDTGLALLNAGDLLWRNHLAQAKRLAADIRAHRVPKPDVVVFPESVADVESANSPKLAQLADLLGVPVAVGVREFPPGGPYRNAVVGWTPNGGKAGEYVKQKLVPYGEYVPLRSIASWLSPFVNNEGDLTPGDSPGVIQLGTAGRSVKVGFAICYEVSFDDPLRGAVRSGAQVLALPTNNEWYGRSEASYQQLAMAQERAVEHGRAVIVAATTGVSAIVAPDGSISTASQLYTATDLVATVPLRDSITLADRLGVWPEWTLVVLGLIGTALGIRARIRDRPARASGKSGGTVDD
ncbi:MAG: apolipoprotein N-acyltransferase [Sciscionella sp.]|nr:apolipoprotein N-acyltransferase [Sciscionella sp.]